MPATTRKTKRGIPRGTLVNEAFERIRDLIVTGRLAPGAPIIETEMAVRIGVQRSHLRLALQRLQHVGFVITTARGAYSRAHVAPLTEEDAIDLFALVGAIEGVAARSAAALPARERAELAGELSRINAELLAASRARPAPYGRFYDLDVAFHSCYVERAAPPRALALHETVKPQADRYERFYTNVLVDQIAISVAEHDTIIQAISAGDAEAAQHAVEVNWRNAAERLRTIISHAGERGYL